jgi:hypothetical protein
LAFCLPVLKRSLSFSVSQAMNDVFLWDSRAFNGKLPVALLDWLAATRGNTLEYHKGRLDAFTALSLIH